MTYIKEFTLTPQPRVSDAHPFVTLNIRERATLVSASAPLLSQAWTDTTPSTVAPTQVEVPDCVYEDGYLEFQWVDGLGNFTPWYGPVGGPPATSTPVEPATFTVLDWLRRLLEDVPRIESDTGAADAVRTDFYVSNPPITGGLAVSVDGVAQNSGFAAIDTRGVRFTTAPADGATVKLDYTTSTWPDSELSYYIAQAQLEWTEDRDVVYAAAIYGIDTLLVGLASSLEFGAGAEQFNLPGVFERLVSLRASFSEILAAAADRPYLQLEPVYFPSRDPSYPGGYYGAPFDDIDFPTV